VGRSPGGEAVRVEKVLALTGYRPDLSYLSELQVRISPATEGAGGLAQALANIKDCLSPVVVRPEQLESGEPGFHLVGHKSYGRLNSFLLRSGLEQLEALFRKL
jgi:hypothetical protein